MDLKKILPKDGPPINEVSKYIEKYKNDLIVIKYGGNVFIDRNIFDNFISDIKILNNLGISIAVVHGGGPRIKRELDKSNIQSKFIRGLRITDKNIIGIVENVLIDFNNDIVNSLKKHGTNAISIHTKKNNIITVIPEAKELGYVGVPKEINNNIIEKIINMNQIPIISPLGLDLENKTYYDIKPVYSYYDCLLENIINLVQKIDEYSLSKKRNITVPLLKEILESWEF